jgi:hypothetical protein
LHYLKTQPSEREIYASFLVRKFWWDTGVFAEIPAAMKSNFGSYAVHSQ